MAKSRKPKAPSARKPGRPKAASPVVTPDIIEGIASDWLMGVSLSAIAKRFRIDKTTVRHHLNQTIRPMWHEQMRSRLDEDLAKVALIERIAWERFQSNAPGETIEQIEKALIGGKGRLRLVKQATRSVTRTGEAAWLQIIQWCLDFRARIHAHYAPTRTHIDIGGEMRVAGMGPSEVDQIMLDRLMTQIAERRNRIGGSSQN